MRSAPRAHKHTQQGWKQAERKAVLREERTAGVQAHATRVEARGKKSSAA